LLQSQAPLIVARFALSLDGFSAGPGGRPTIFAAPDFGDGKTSHGIPEFAASVDAVAMGRVIFDPAVDDSGWPWPGLDVHVLSSRELPEKEFETPVTVHSDPEEMVKALRGYERGVLVLGGPRTIQTLIDLGAVDRLEVLLVPVLFGDGTPFALDGTPTRPLSLTGAKTFDDGVAQLTYEFA
jgi:dihydrofolate reductase